MNAQWLRAYVGTYALACGMHGLALFLHPSYALGHPMIAVTELTSLEQLSEYRLLWRSLHGRTPGAGFFQTRECLESYLRHAGPEVSLRTLVVSVALKPVGIVPLVQRPVASRLGNVQALTYPMVDLAGFMGPLGPNPAATMLGALKHLRDVTGEWELLDLRGVDEAGVDGGRTANAFRMAELPVSRRRWSSVGIIDLELFDAGRQFQLRRRLLAAERSLWQQGRWEHVFHAPQGWSAASEFEQLWDQLSPLFADQSASQQAFLRDLALTAARQNGLGVQVLQQNDQPIGCLLTLAGNNRVDVLAAVAPSPVAADVLIGRLLFDDIISGRPRVVFNPRLAHLTEGWEPQMVETARFTRYRSLRPRAQLLRLSQWLRPQSTLGLRIH